MATLLPVPIPRRLPGPWLPGPCPVMMSSLAVCSLSLGVLDHVSPVIRFGIFPCALGPVTQSVRVILSVVGAGRGGR